MEIFYGGEIKGSSMQKRSWSKGNRALPLCFIFEVLVFSHPKQKYPTICSHLKKTLLAALLRCSVGVSCQENAEFGGKSWCQKHSAMGDICQAISFY